MDDFDSAYFISPFRRFVTLTAAGVLAVLLIWGPLRDLWPVSLLAIGMDMMGTFFHELGHTIFWWLFGYPTLPSFDFQHGGGMSWYFGREPVLEWGLIIAAAYGVWFVWRHHRGLGIAAAVIFILYAGAMFTEFHHIISLFMGHGGEIVVGSFILARVILDAVPPRPGELEVHALAGWYLIFHPIQLSWGLIYDPDVQDSYWAQKGSEGFGDFSRIADYFGFANETPVAWLCIGVAVLGVMVPFSMKWAMGRFY